jgi:hypothetical protein
MKLEKAYIVTLDNPKREITCLFNPTEYTFTKTNQWKTETVMGQDVPPSIFLGGGPITLTMALFFDTYESKEDVRKYTNDLLRLTYVDPKLGNDKNKQGRPPRCQFNWGTTWSFKAVITQVTQRFTLFLENGTPVRATVTVTFQQVEQQGIYPPQNPTSQGLEGRRVRIVRNGDRLDWIAYEEYGDPGLWRLIADASGLDNPLKLQPGQRLVIAQRGYEKAR